MANKKYVSLNRLSDFLDNLKNTFLKKSDYVVDSALSSTSTNPVANSVLNAEFEEIARAMNIYGLAIDDKADKTHSHDDVYYTEGEIDSKLSTINTSINNIKSGDVVVKEAEHSTSADSAATATSANHATTADSAISAGSATKATQDASGNVITSTYETKSDASKKLTEAKTYTDTVAAGKADATHSHNNYVPTSRTVNGKALSQNITLSASDVGALPSTTSIPDALADLTGDSTHRTVTDTEKATWNAKSNFSGSYNDLTNKPTIPSISGLATEEYVDTKTSSLASTTVVDNKISSHNTSTTAHSDIRELITNLTTRLNALANSTDEDLDQMAEIVDYIKSNKSLIDSITTSKINVSDIVNNLTTNSTSKVLSAAQGVAIKSLIDTHTTDTTHITSTERTNWNTAITTANTAKANAATAQTKADEAYSLAGQKAQVQIITWGADD